MAPQLSQDQQDYINAINAKLDTPLSETEIAEELDIAGLNKPAEVQSETKPKKQVFKAGVQKFVEERPIVSSAVGGAAKGIEDIVSAFTDFPEEVLRLASEQKGSFDQALESSDVKIESKPFRLGEHLRKIPGGKFITDETGDIDISDRLQEERKELFGEGLEETMARGGPIAYGSAFLGAALPMLATMKVPFVGEVLSGAEFEAGLTKGFEKIFSKIPEGAKVAQQAARVVSKGAAVGIANTVTQVPFAVPDSIDEDGTFNVQKFGENMAIPAALGFGVGTVAGGIDITPEVMRDISSFLGKKTQKVASDLPKKKIARQQERIQRAKAIEDGVPEEQLGDIVEAPQWVQVDAPRMTSQVSQEAQVKADELLTTTKEGMKSLPDNERGILETIQSINNKKRMDIGTIRKMTAQLIELDRNIVQGQERISEEVLNLNHQLSKDVSMSVYSGLDAEDYFKRGMLLSALQKKFPDNSLLRKVSNFAKETFTPLSEQLGHINPKLKESLKAHEFAKLQRAKVYMEPVQKFIKDFNAKFTPEQSKEFGVYLNDGNAEAARKFLKVNGAEDLIAELDNVYEMNDLIFGEMKRFGKELGYIENYWHREIKDYDKFLDRIGRADSSLIKQKWSELAKKKGVKVEELTHLEKSMAVTDFIKKQSEGGVGFVKQRKISKVGEYDDLYVDWQQSAINYADRAANLTQDLKFLGRGRNKVADRLKDIGNRLNKDISRFEIKEEIAKLERIQKEFLSDSDKIELSTSSKTFSDDYVEVGDKLLEDLQRDIRNVTRAIENKTGAQTMEESVGQLMTNLTDDPNVNLTREQEKEALDLFRTYFVDSKKHMNEAMQTLRSMSYIGGITNLGSTITQLTESAYSAINSGVGKAFKGTVDATGTIFDADKRVIGKIGLDDLDVIQQDLKNDPDAIHFLDRVLDKSLKMTGFKSMDKLAKESFVRGAFEKLQDSVAKGLKDSRSKDFGKFHEKWSKVFDTPGQMEDFMQALKDGDPNNQNVLYALYHELSDYQPVSLSEMPAIYIKHPNGRVFYALKGFTIKQMSMVREKILSRMKDDPIGATKDMIKYMAYFGGAQYATDKAKDAMYGREEDNVELPVLGETDPAMIEAVLKSTTLLNRYFLSYGLRTLKGETIDGPEETALKLYTSSPLGAPILSYGVNILADAMTLAKAEDKIDDGVREMRTLRQVPIAGDWAYYHWGRALKSKEKRAEREDKEMRREFKKLGIDLPRDPIDQLEKELDNLLDLDSIME